MATPDLTIPEFARELPCSECTVRRKVLSGEIVARKVLGRWRIPREELNRILGEPCVRSAETDRRL
jgi:excisionase family DNA binding protein